MSWSECKPVLESESLGGGRLSLKFSLLSFGIHSFLCKIEKESGEILMEKFTGRPSAGSRFFFRVTHGLKDFEPLFRVASSKRDGDSIEFYRCKDRRNRERIFGCAAVWKGEGTIFLSKQDYFEKVLARLEELEEEGRRPREAAVSAAI